MAYTSGFSVTIGDPTKASDVAVLAANDDYLKSAVDAKAVLTGTTNDTVTTVTAANALQGEADLTFASNKLTVFGTTGTGTATAGVLNLSTRELTVIDADQLGRIDFQAPAETGSDAQLVTASIYAEADVAFDATNNATDLVLATAHDGAAAERFRITSQGEIGLAGANYGTDGYVLTSAGAGAAAAWEALPSSGISFSGSTANGVVTYGNSSTANVESNLVFNDSTNILAVGSNVQIRAGDTAAGDDAAMGWQTADGLVLTGQGSTSDVTIKNDADATVMSIPTGTTKVGIGTTAPTALNLSVYEAGITVTNIQAHVANFIGDGYQDSQVFIGDAAAVAADIGGKIQFGGKYNGNDCTEFVSIGGFKENSTGGEYGAYFAIETRAHGSSLAERMRITSAGNVLMGHTALGNHAGTTTQVLDVASTGGVGISLDQYSDNANGAQLILAKSRSGTKGAMDYPESGDDLGRISFFGSDEGNARFDQGCYIAAKANENWANNSSPSNIQFYTVAVGYALVKRMQINASASPAITVTGTAGLSTGTAWTDTSDSRIKTSVQTITGALAKINSLRPVSFEYTDQYLSVHDEIDGTKTYNSFIAEEYEAVFPNAVSTQGDLVKTVYADREDVVEAQDAVLYAEGDDDIPDDKDVGDVRTPAVEAVGVGDELSSETLLTDLKGYTPHDLHMYLVAAVQELSTKVTALEAA